MSDTRQHVKSPACSTASRHTADGLRSQEDRTLRAKARPRRLLGLQVGSQERIQPGSSRECQARDPRREHRRYEGRINRLSADELARFGAGHKWAATTEESLVEGQTSCRSRFRRRLLCRLLLGVGGDSARGLGRFLGGFHLLGVEGLLDPAVGGFDVLLVLIRTFVEIGALAD